MKRLTIILTIIAILISLASCGDNTTQNTTTDGSEESSVVSSENASNPEGEEGKKGFDFENMTVGKIDRISGNQVTLKLGTINMEDFSMPEMPSDFSKPEGEDGERPSMPEGMSMPEGENGERPSMPEGEDGERPSMPEGMSMPEGEFPGKGGGNGFNFEVEIDYTGETAKYTIPAEVKVGNSDYTSLSKGMVIGLETDENGIVTSVMILNEKG